MTLLVNSTGSFAAFDFGSALAMESVYKSENLGSLEETTKPVLLKNPCTNELQLRELRNLKFLTVDQYPHA